jgi:hypothetical protein
MRLKRAGHPFAIVVFVSLLLAGPLLWFGFPSWNVDGAFHIRWLHHVAGQFWSGELYPRYFPELNNDFGSPSFFFYPPLSTMAGVFLWPMAGPGREWYALGWSAAFGLVLSGVFMWLFLKRCLEDPRAATVGALLYVLAPYHLGVDLLDRGANAEFWAFAFMPLVLLSFHRLSGEARTVESASRWSPSAAIHFLHSRAFPSKHVMLAALGLAGLFYCHVLTAITFAPIAFAYAWFLGRSTLARAVTAGFWAVLLSAVYLLPAAMYSSYVSGSTNDFFVGKLISTTFFFPDLKWQKPLPVSNPFYQRMFVAFIGQSIVQVVCVAAFARGMVVEGRRRLMLIWMIALHFCVVMMLPISGPLYAIVPPLQRLQFAWRFLSPATLASSVIIGILWQSTRRQHWSGVYLCGVALTGWLVTALYVNGELYQENNLKAQGEWRTNFQTFQFNALDAFGEYVPAGGNMAQAQALFETTTNPTPRSVRLTSGQGQISVQYQTPRKLILECDSKNGFQFVLHQFWFPGWLARDSKSGAMIPVKQHLASGLIEIDAPEGQRRLELRLSRLWPETIGIVATTASAGWLGAIALWRLLWRRRADSRENLHA